MTQTNPSQTCPICGRNEFVWGELQAQGIQFINADAGFLERFFAFGSSLRARLCTHCKNVQVFANAGEGGS